MTVGSIKDSRSPDPKGAWAGNPDSEWIYGTGPISNELTARHETRDAFMYFTMIRWLLPGSSYQIMHPDSSSVIFVPA
jgi:hypothetical protein